MSDEALSKARAEAETLHFLQFTIGDSTIKARQHAQAADVLAYLETLIRANEAKLAELSPPTKVESAVGIQLERGINDLERQADQS